jgi:hypothetical protein
MTKRFSRFGLVLSILTAWNVLASRQDLNLKAARELMPVVCQAGGSAFVENTEKNPFIRCNPCPSFTSFAGDGDSLSLTNVIFAKPLRQTEILVIMDVNGCEPHANNFGGTVLLRWLGLTKWQFVRYDAGRRTSDCLKFAGRDGLDRLVCQNGWSGQGFNTQGVTLENFAPGKDGTDLVRTTSNAGQCFDAKYFDFEIKSVLARDVNRDGRKDLWLEVSERHFVAPKNWNCGDEIPWATSKLHRLEFVFDGLRFVPSKRTAALVAYFKKFSI